MFWRLLEPFTTTRGGVKILCPRCRMDLEPTCKEQ